jgi:polyisoprenoid-binding protein YceI
MGDWQLDPYHTQVEFAAKHLGMMTVRGHFADVTSSADIDPDHLEDMRVEVTIQAASIRTHNEIRDNGLHRRTSSRRTRFRSSPSPAPGWRRPERTATR